MPDVHFLSKLLKASASLLKNDYINRQFGYNLQPAIPFGHLIFKLMPLKKRRIDKLLRHLPSPKSSMDRILDIGCGNGEFLEMARDKLGYSVEGLELDERAAETARACGLTVHSGAVPGSGLNPGYYHHITMSHVVEHLHDPAAALTEVFDLLLPGGRVWIGIPNVGASSIDQFGSNSRLLEPPRHLVMFDACSLSTLMKKIGFLSIQEPEPIDFDSHDAIFIQSWIMSKGIDPNAPPSSVVPKSVRKAFKRAYRNPVTLRSKPEILTLIGSKLA